VTVFATGIGYMSRPTDDGSELHGGVGLALSYRWGLRFGAEVSVTSQRYRGEAIGILADSGRLIRDHVRSEPVDLVAQYHFATRNRWKPYAGLGVHFLNARDADSLLSPQVNGGVFFSLTPNVALRLDARYVIGNRTAFHDPAVKPSFGMALRF
jgi:outer membrane protein W